MILQQLNAKKMKNTFEKEKLVNKKIYIHEIASYRKNVLLRTRSCE